MVVLVLSIGIHVDLVGIRHVDVIGAVKALRKEVNAVHIIQNKIKRALITTRTCIES